jgi:phosphoinositide-3-kinase regulatory subunit 4
MDIFSLGCVIAEVFLEGEVLFDHSQLLSFRDNRKYELASLSALLLFDHQLDSITSITCYYLALLCRFEPTVLLRKIETPFRALIEHMLQLNPADRWSAKDYLEVCMRVYIRVSLFLGYIAHTLYGPFNDPVD